MQEISLTVHLYGEDLINESNWEPIRCEVIGPFGSVVYHAVKDARGFLFLNRNEGGLNGYHESLRGLIMSALMSGNSKVYSLS
jgi:hypothetical protein